MNCINKPENFVDINGNGDSEEFVKRLKHNRRLSDILFYPLLVAYITFIVFGVLANILTISLVIRQQRSNKKHLRHWLMVNLSVSDLLLCLVTMPLTYMELVCYSWPLGNNPVLCKLTGSLAALSIFCSTFTIASIAVDRYLLVIQTATNHSKLSPIWSAVVIFCIWLVSGALASPLFLFRTLIHNPLPEDIYKRLGISSVDYCIEDWPAPYWSFGYSIYSSVLTFLIPVMVIVLAHTSICARLSPRFRQNNPNNKTHKLLIAIAATFASCWLPLNLFNLVDYAGGLYFIVDHHELKLTLYAICHLIGMSSACFHPILYGWYNSTLRTDFTNFFSRIVNSFGFKSSTNITNSTQTTTRS